MMSNPATHSSTASPRRTGGHARLPRKRDPGSRRRQAQREPQPEMSQAGEALAVGITQKPEQEPARTGTAATDSAGRAGWLPRRPGCSIAVKTATARTPSRPAGRCRAGRARIERIKMPIGQPVEGHRRRPRGRHAEQNAHPVLNSSVPAVAIVRRQDRAQKRKRQGEQRVAELHQIEIFANLDDARLLRDQRKRRNFS